MRRPLNLLRPLALVCALLIPVLAYAAPQPFDLYARGPYHAGVPKPSDILGYEPGTFHTTWGNMERVLDAIQHARPERVRREPFGRTVEARERSLFIVSSPANLARLDAIRDGNDKLADPRGVPAADIAATRRTLLAVIELLLGLLGTRELSGAYWLWRKSSARVDLWSTQLDLACWAVLAVLGVVLALIARRLARELDRRAQSAEATQLRQRLSRVALGAAIVHVVVWAMGWPWPHRFSAAMVLLLGLTWLASTPGRGGRWMRGLAVGLMPETSGRGLWNGQARRRILERIVAEGDGRRIAGEATSLVVSALAIDSGRIGHFVSWPAHDPTFEAHLVQELGEIGRAHV